MMKNLQIKDLTISDIPEAMNLVLYEGWNQTEKDWQLFLENPENVCKCALVDNKLVGTITSYNFSNQVAWISMVLVNKNFRGCGISKVLMNSVLKELTEVKSIKLDATDAGGNVYRKFGFIDEYKISRWICNSFNQKTVYVQTGVEKTKVTDLNKIVDFDTRTFGGERKAIISSWHKYFPEKAWILKEESQIIGFSVGRQGNRFHQIGPVSAKNSGTAVKLISKCLEQLNGKPVLLDVMDDKTELAKWLEEIGFKRKRGFSRMYLKKNPFPGNTQSQFLIAGPEFG